MHVCKENVGYVFKVVRDTFLKIPPHSVSMWEYWWHRSRKETDTDTTLESSPSSEYPSVDFCFASLSIPLPLHLLCLFHQWNIFLLQCRVFTVSIPVIPLLPLSMVIQEKHVSSYFGCTMADALSNSSLIFCEPVGSRLA